MRLRWHPRHTFWLVLTLVVIAVVFGRRMMSEREITPIGDPEERGNAATQVQPELSIVHRDLPPLETFDGSFHFVSVRISEATGEAGHRLVLTLTQHVDGGDDDGDDVDGTTYEVVLAAVAVAPEASEAARAAVMRRVRDGLRGDMPLYLIRLAEHDEATQLPVVYAARAHGEQRPSAEQELPYWLVNRKSLYEAAVQFDETIAASHEPQRAEQALALAVLAGATSSRLREGR